MTGDSTNPSTQTATSKLSKQTKLSSHLPCLKATTKTNAEDKRSINEMTTSTNTKSATSKLPSTKKSCKSSDTAKIDPRYGGPSPFRQLLPIALCVLSFATVISILIVYMDTTEIRHQQFKLNMSRDYELVGVAQDDPTLVAFIRDFHMKKYPMNFLKNAPIEHLNFTEHHELTPEMAHYIANLVGDKTNGVFIQSLTGPTSESMTAPWLAETLNWGGLIIEPEPRRYFTYRKQNVHRPKVQVVHACVSTSGYPKEVTLHNDEDAEVRINSLLDEESSWFNSRVKCFPLYSLMLAVNRTNFDLLSLGCGGHELQILQTLPFDAVNIEVISIHLTESQENAKTYLQSITKLLFGKFYKYQRKFGTNYIFRKVHRESLN